MIGAWIAIAWFALQILSGRTIGCDQFKGFDGGTHIFNGSLARLVHRDEEPIDYWILIATQMVLLIIYKFTTKPAEDRISILGRGTV